MYSQEIKEKALSLREKGKPAKDVCSMLDISSSVLHKWEIEKAIVLPEGLSEKQQLWILKQRLYEANQKLEIWENCTCSRKSPLKEKYGDLERLVPKYGVHAVCSVLKVSRESYYNHALRSPARTQLQIKDEKLRPVVKQLFEETNGMLGSKKMRILMMNQGYTIDLKHLRRLMEEMDLYCTTRQKAAHNTEPPKQQFYRNLLRRQFETYEPNKVWVSDTTYIYLNYDPYYLTVIIDLFSRKVIGYAVVDTIAAFPLIRLVKKTFAERGCPEGLLFHSDQGSQYTAYRFRVLLRGYKIRQSFSGPGNPHDNAVAEAFFKNFKAELIYRSNFENISDMRKRIDDYIVFYNGVRPHNKLSGKTPDQFEKEYYEKVNKEL